MGKLTPMNVDIAPAKEPRPCLVGHSRVRSRSANVPHTSGGRHAWPTRPNILRLPSFLLSLLILCSSSIAALAQATFPTPAADLPPKDSQATKSTSKSPNPTTPSRFITEANFTPYVTAVTAEFSMRGRTSDPFGQLQDPDVKRILKAPIGKSHPRTAPIQATPFADIIRLIKVTTVIPKEQRFLIGTRTLKQGDSLSLNYRGKPIHVQITAVSSHQIDFSNLDTHENASLKLDLLPAGMTPGAYPMSAPGMTHDRMDAPLELDPSSQSNNNSATR